MRPFLLLSLIAACRASTDGSADTGLVVDGATVDEAALFQAVAVPLFRGGEEVANDARTAPVIAGRDAVLRVRLDVPEDVDVEGLSVSVDVLVGERLDTRSAEVVELGGVPTAIVDVPAELLSVDAAYVLRVHDEAGTHARVPAEGATPFGAIETGPIELRLVPFEVNGFTPDTSSAVIEGMREALMAVYPITSVAISVADVQVWEGALDLGDINVQVGVLQEDDMGAGRVSWSTYYYGLVTGVATRDEYTGITGTSEDGGDGELVRAYFAAGAAFGDARAEETLLHELGHVHGLAHTACDGEPDPDPEYPHEGGVIGVEGYDRRTGMFVE